MALAFSRTLRESTSAVHSDVEHREFITLLMNGRLDARAYAMLLNQYAHIYARLEDKVRRFASDPLFAPFADARLDRHARILADLRALGQTGLPVVEATALYCRRLGQVETPEELIAHHYTRYLGDLSGGQAIAALVARHYGIPDSALQTWDFSELGGTKPYKDAYRAELDGIGARGGDENLVALEAFLAFELNGEVLTQLGTLLAPRWAHAA